MNMTELSRDYRAARTLQIANGLGIFTLLAEGGMPAEEIARECGTKPDLTEKLLIACASMGLLEKAGANYTNTPLAQTYLVKGRKFYQGDMIAHSARMWDFWNDLDDNIRLEEAPRPQPDDHRHFIMAMHNIAITGRAQMIAETIDLSTRNNLLDVGGGPGTYSIVLCARNPRLRATVFDLPETIAITREVIAGENMADRVHVQEGDWNADSFGQGYDVVLMSNVLHGRTTAPQMKLAKAFDAAADGALLIMQEFVLNDDKTGPLIPALFNLMIGAYSRPELFEDIRKAGFVDPKIALEMEEHGSMVITAVKP
ncbi:MAG: methyltransferase [Planctomycetes bacterium]|nr:methyltransferase [Planctomycetota bacterium]